MGTEVDNTFVFLQYLKMRYVCSYLDYIKSHDVVELWPAYIFCNTYCREINFIRDKQGKEKVVYSETRNFHRKFIRDEQGDALT
jgi:hypothetical protein